MKTSIESSGRPHLLCVCGPTATGKTDLAFYLAQHFKTEIISFDSVQVYKEMDIGTAKPPQAMREAVIHHLIDAVAPNENFTAGDFRRRALETIAELKKTKPVIVLVGGTGFYLQALLKGMYPSPAVSPELKLKLEDELRERGLKALYDELCGHDPKYGEKIHAHDEYRILRALEVIRAGGKTMSAIQREFSAQKPDFDFTLIGLKREKEKLLQSVIQRTEKMIQDGLIDETRHLIEKYGSGLRPLESVGYKETKSFLNGEIPQSELIDHVVKSTMALAKRQMTWFKREAATHWSDGDLGTETIAEKIIEQTAVPDRLSQPPSNKGQ